MRKSYIKRILAALCAGMVLTVGTAAAAPISADDIAEEETPAATDEESSAAETTGEESSAADAAEDGTDGTSSEADGEGDAEPSEDEIARSKAATLTAAMDLRQKIAQMLMLNVRYWTPEPAEEEGEEGSTESSEENSEEPSEGATEEGEENNGEAAQEAEPLPVTELNPEMTELLEKYDFGGVVLFAENLTGTEQATRFTAQIQESAANNPNCIPYLIAADQEGGRIVRLGTGTDTCGNMALGATNNPDYAYDSANIIGKELDAVGINVDFAPVLDVNNNPKNPVINLRSFSSDAELVSKMGLAYMEGLNANNVIGCVKHFPGHGDTDTDSHTGLPLVDRSYDELKDRELVPFKAAFDADADMLMTAHIQYPQIESAVYTSISSEEEVHLPATLSRTFLTDIVREDMGFDGVIITDDMQMDALKENFDVYDSAVMAINAGADMLLDPVNAWSAEGIEELELYMDKIEEAVQDGTISEERINEACTRILTLKYKRGLFDEEQEDVETRVEKALEIVGSEENHQQEMEITLHSVTLVQNNDNLLPLHLNDDESVAFFYPEDSVSNSFRYAFDQLKADGTLPENANAEYNAYSGRSAESFREVVENAKYVVISSETRSESDLDPATDDEHPENMAKFIDEMIELAHSMDKKVVVMSMYLPYDVARYTAADAVLAGYGPKGMPVIPEEYNGELPTYGPNYPAAVMTIFGASEPSAKLPVTVYKLDENYHYTDEELYPIGHGLAYAEQEPEDQDSSESSSGNNSNKNNDKNKGAPKTGDSTPLLPAGAIAAAAAAVCTVCRKNRRR